MSMLSKVREFFQGLVPVKRVTVHDPRAAMMGVAVRMDVERVHALFESADGGDPRELFALYEEIVLTHSHLQGEFSKRLLVVLGDAFSIQPVDKKNAADVKAAALVKAQVEAVPGFLRACIHLLSSTVWPVALVEKVYRPVGGGFALAGLVPVPHQLLDWSAGRLRIRATDCDGRETGQFHEFEEAHYILHRGHLLGFADFRGGPLRSLVWWWLLTTMDREWWARFLDRYGAPFVVGKYDQADDASRSVLERAFSYATKIGGLVVSKETQVELVQSQAGAAGDAYEKFWTIGCREMSKLIIGQTGSAESQAQGLGSGASAQHEQVRDDIRAWDAACLSVTLQRELFEQILRVNGASGAVPLAVWGGESGKQAGLTGALLQSLAAAGLRVTDEGMELLSQRVGFPLERMAAAAAPMSFGARPITLSASPLASADKAGDAIARAGAADLARAFSGAFAPVRRAILDAPSPEALQSELIRLYADWPAGRISGLIEEALVAYAANRILVPN